MKHPIFNGFCFNEMRATRRTLLEFVESRGFGILKFTTLGSCTSRLPLVMAP